jgi:asparagine synthase (glutamine-hydrolysing)
MCGIAGLINLKNIEKKISSDLNLEIKFIDSKLSHRGDEKFDIKYLPNNNFFYHNRLSIIDLNNRSKQPLSDITKKYFITFNGEIYNYKDIREQLIHNGIKFKTESDTEVLLNSYIYWGEKFIQKINGMFSFAIYDSIKNKYYVFRDRFGIKPLYYSIINDQLKFASESQALTFKNNSLDQDAINAYLLGMFVPGKLSFFKDVYKLLPGNYLKIENQEVSIHEYYNLENTINESSEKINFEKTDSLLKKTISEHLNSDVKVLNYLSAGLDSSLIAKYSSELKSKIETVSLNYENSNYPEAEKAHKFASKLKISNNIINISNYVYLINFYRVFSNINEPIADSAIVSNYILSKYAKKSGFKVVLNGSGGDEIFCGYERYLNLGFKRKFFYFFVNVIPDSLKKLLQKIFPDKMLRLQNGLYEMFIAASGCTGVLDLIFNTTKQKNNFLIKLISYFPKTKNINFNKTKSRMINDIKINLSENLNSLFDQATMLNTIEGRVPYQDHNLVEYFLNSSNLQKNKIHQHELLSNKLNRKFNYKKKGFGAPVSNLIIEKKEFFKSLLKRGNFNKYINRNIIEYCSNKIDKQKINEHDSQLVFRTCAFIIWESYLIKN